MQYLIGLDIGTTSTKAVAFDHQGKQLALTSHGYPLINPKEGWYEQDPEVILGVVERAVRELVGKVPGVPEAISISCAMHGLMLIDAHNRPLTHLVIWADQRSEREAQVLKASKEGAAIYFASGTPIHPMSPLCKLLWFQKNEAGLMKRAARFISIKEYLLFKWLGQYVIDQSLASATGLYNNHLKQWNDLSLQVADIRAEQLAEAVPTTTVFNGINSGPSIAMGIPASTKVVIGASDGCLANLGSGILDGKTASLTIGTSSAFRKTISHFAKDEKQRIFNYILTPDLYVVGGPSNNGGVVAEWFQKQFGDGKFDEQSLRRVPAGSEGLLFLPYLLGERAPVWNAEARGVYFGISMAHSKDHFYRAVWEGIFVTVGHIVGSVEEVSGVVENVVVSGGFAKSEYLVQMVADVLQKRIVACSVSENSALGAALLALHALGHVKHIADTARLVEFETEYLPDKLKADVYRKALEKSTRIYEKLKGEFGG